MEQCCLKFIETVAVCCGHGPPYSRAAGSFRRTRGLGPGSSSKLCLARTRPVLVARFISLYGLVDKRDRRRWRVIAATSSSPASLKVDILWRSLISTKGRLLVAG